MGKIIENSTGSDIIVSTEAGAFRFPAHESVELADERAELVDIHGKWYIRSGELVVRDSAPEAKQEVQAQPEAAPGTEEAAKTAKKGTK